MKVSELAGAQLDYWVARADPDCGDVRWERQGDDWIGFGVIGSSPEFPALIITDASTLRDRLALQDKHGRANIYEPRRNWCQGGPIIDRERIYVAPLSQHDSLGELRGMWMAKVRPSALGDSMHYGPTALVAAMRAYVTSKFGHEVADEKRTQASQDGERSDT